MFAHSGWSTEARYHRGDRALAGLYPEAEIYAGARIRFRYVRTGRIREGVPIVTWPIMLAVEDAAWRVVLVGHSKSLPPPIHVISWAVMDRDGPSQLPAPVQ